MARNQDNFILKRYRQPYNYEKRFQYWNALYHTAKGNTLIIEAKPHFLSSEPEGALIDSYSVLLRKAGEGIKSLFFGLKTQKAAIEKIEKYINKL